MRLLAIAEGQCRSRLRLLLQWPYGSTPFAVHMDPER
jgi:hypothetical protein